MDTYKNDAYAEFAESQRMILDTVIDTKGLLSKTIDALGKITDILAKTQSAKEEKEDVIHECFICNVPMCINAWNKRAKP